MPCMIIKMCLHAGLDDPSMMESFVGLPPDKNELGDPARAASRCPLDDLHSCTLQLPVVLVYVHVIIH